MMKPSVIFRFYVVKNCIWRRAYEALKFNHEGFLDNYIRRILNFTSSIKGSLKGTLENKKKYLEKNIHQHIFDSYTPKEGIIHEVYFFECFKETEKKENCAAPKKWDEKSQNVAAYPVWTIKRSKYYSVPQTKNVTEVVPERQVEEKEHQGDSESLKLEDDSLEDVVEPIKDNESQMQVSQVSVLSMELPREVESDAEADNVPKKKEIRRKVSFRDEVDISGFERNNSEDRNLDTEEYKNYPESAECDQNFYEDVNYTLEKSPSLDLQEDAKQLTSRISDLLMTDSLMQMAEVIPNATEKLKSSMKKTSVKNLNLTESAREVLAKLSRSFVDEGYTKTSGIISIDFVPQFYDQEGNPITEIRNFDGDVLFKLYNKNVDELNSVLFDSEGVFLKNRYDANGKRIKAVYDVDGRIIRRISQINDDIKSIQTDLENVEYYDYKGKPIQKLYDSSGYEIKTVGKDLTSKIFDADGTLHKNIYTRKGRRIDAVFDSHGRLIGKTSNSQLEPVVRSEIRVAKMDGDSLNKLFEGDNKPSKIEKNDNDNPHKRERSPKRLFDQEGNPLIGVYDKKGKPIKLTSSGEADELLPFLFDDKGKLQSKRFDSKGKELKAVFGEDGKAISEMSIAWLNELLANSKLDSPKTKKKGSFFKRNTKSKTRPQRLCDIEKLYDSKGKVITSIFDSKGKPLVVSTSGDANKLIPFLFDSDGKFVRKSYDSEKRRLRCVYGKDGNVINSISVTYLQRIVTKLDKDQNELNEDNNQQKQDEENVSSLKVSEEKVENEEVKSSHSLDCFEKVPDQLFDQDGDVLTEIFDSEGNALAASSSGNAWKLLPHLFDHKGQFLKNRFDKKKRELKAVYNKEGDNLNDDLSSVIKVTVAKSSADKEDSDKKPEEEKPGNEVEMKKDCEYNKSGLNDGVQNEQKESNTKLIKTVSFISSTETPSKINATRKKSSNPEQVELVKQKGKHDRKQLKPTTSITEKQSINQKFDKTEVPLKAGESIYRFYDERGNAITEVYDSKGRKLIRTRSEDVELLSKYLFDKKGFLFENIYDRKGRRITNIFDDQRRNISRISIPSVISGDNILSRQHEKNEKIPGSVYDKNGNLVKKIFDKKGHPLMITKLAKLEDLAPIIFDEKGVRRRIFDKSGNEIGSVYDYKGNELKRFSTSKKPKSASDCRETRIFSKSGRPLRNFYDSEGTLIIALYNDYGKTLCSVRKGVDNVEKLSKFFFDKEGQFLRGRFYNFRGQMIKHVYDSDNNIVRSIKKTASRKIAHYKYSNRDGEKNHRKHTNKMNPRDQTSKHKQRNYHGKSEVRPVENVTGTFSSQSDTILNPATPLVQRSMSAYSLRDYPKRKEIRAQSAASSTSLTNMSIKKFYDEHGRLLTGVYNSKTRLLGYSASGNARVLAPYLFDTKGNFISGRFNLDRKPLKNIYDSSGKLVEKISKPILNKTKEATKASKKSRGFKFHDLNGDEITSVYDLRGEKILDVTGSCEKIANLFDKNGNFKRNLYNYRGSELKVYGVCQESVRRGSSMEDDIDQKEDEKRSKGRFSVLSSFKDKILTVIFDNQHRLSHRLSPQSLKKKARQYMEGERGKLQGIPKRKSNLYDKNLNLIKDIYDDRGKIIRKLYNSDGEVIEELYSVSGTLVKNNVLKHMFEEDVFTPKVFNSEGNLISTIYANRKVLKKVFDEHGGPAKVDSDLIYLVSDRSLPDDASPETSKSETKQVNYFSEGSSYPFPEGQNQNRQIKNQQLIEERDYEAEMEVAFNRYSRRRTDNCICEHCQKMGRNRNNIVQFGENILSRLSRFTLPLSKFLSGNFLRRYDSDEFDGDIDSLETLIDQARKSNAREGTEDSDKEYYSRSSSVMLESDENVTISRKMIEKTLRNCVHLNSSTKVLGKVSDTCGGSREDSCQAFTCDGENDICVGTELKFEDSLIGRHISAQTTEFPTCPGRCRICGSSMECLTQNLDPYGCFNENSIGWDSVNNKAFVCKVPNLQPFIMTMKTKIEAFEKNVEGK
ncbi:uncharacterized protein LOC123315583 isoform X2 [Coccinella septempunctata]|uniref:uncharacterized protein LOC123315583 isoform X2 n=1 Tax=Coccinella septempunctata TaxID=41139 RepID=UPI001D0653B5|nr:uncharacterized protein LOC123315583 isoform X2 [Coccinella septempunctata]